MNVQVLYFDGCPNHHQTLELAKDVLRELEVDARIETVEVKTREDAQRLHFLGSPTVLVDGVDVEPAARDRTEYSFSCRTYEGLVGVPPRVLLLDSFREATARTKD